MSPGGHPVETGFDYHDEAWQAEQRQIMRGIQRKVAPKLAEVDRARRVALASMHNYVIG